MPSSGKAPRVLVIVNVYRPDLGGGVLFADLCEGLAERGMEVTVRCAVPYYPEWSDKEGRNGFRILESVEQGVRVQRFGLYIPSDPNSFLQRLVYEASFFLSLMRRPVRKDEFDAMLVFCPLVGSVAYAGLNARWRGIPLWLNVQDLSAQAAAAGGIASDTSILERIQNALFRKADFWSSISAPMIDVLRQVPGAPDHVALIPNWMHSTLASLLEGAQPREPIPAGRPIRLLYSGNVGGKQHLQAFCERLLATDANVEFQINAAGSRAAELSAWIEAQQDPRIHMAALTDEPGLAEALARADAYVITEKPGAGSSFIPSKLIPGMTSGAPILAVCDPDGPLGQEVRAHGTGFLAEWSDEGAINRFLDIVRDDPDTYVGWSRSAIERGRFYHRERGIDRCVEAIDGLLDPSSSTN